MKGPLTGHRGQESDTVLYNDMIRSVSLGTTVLHTIRSLFVFLCVVCLTFHYPIAVHLCVFFRAFPIELG